MTEDLKSAWRRYRAILPTVLTGGAGQATLVVSGVLSARILGVSGRGTFALFSLIAVIIVQLGSLGVPVAATYFVARDKASGRSLVRSLRWLVAGQTLVLSGLQVVLLFIFFRGESSQVVAAAFVSAGLVPGSMAQNLGQSILQGEEAFRKFNIWRLMPVATNALAVLLLWLAGWGNILTISVALSATTLGVGLVTLFVAVSNLPNASGATAAVGSREVLIFGVKAMLGAVYPSETFQIDQAFVGIFLQPAALGLYVTSVAFTNLPRFIAQSIGYVAYPSVASISEAQEARKEVWRFLLMATVIVAAVCGVLEASVGFLLPLFFGSAFSAAIPITRIILIGSFFASLRRVFSDCVRGAGRPLLGSLAELAALLLLLVLLVAFIQAWGLTGAAVATVVAAASGLLIMCVGWWRS